MRLWPARRHGESVTIPPGASPQARQPSAEPQSGAARRVRWETLAPLATTQPACCCPAKPVVTAFLPAAKPGGTPVDVLLCGHHARASLPALEAAGAVVFDAAGRLLVPGGWEPQPESGSEAASAPSACIYPPL